MPCHAQWVRQLQLPSYIYVWQPAARGHRAYTDLSAARVRGPVLCTVCSLVNWEMTHMQPSEPDPLLTYLTY